MIAGTFLLSQRFVLFDEQIGMVPWLKYDFVVFYYKYIRPVAVNRNTSDEDGGD